VNYTRFVPGELVDGRFQLVSKVGTGSFGVIFFARDLDDAGREVALKVLKPSALGQGSLIERFRREAQVCTLLEHAFTPHCHYLGSLRVEECPEPLPYMALDLIRGLSLRQIIRARGPLWVAEASFVLLGVLSCLDEVHARGFVHRDLKPDNILVIAPKKTWTIPQDRGPATDRLGIPGNEAPVWRDITKLPVAVIDFGLAKPIQAATHDFEYEALTQEGQAAGTAEYMSPEQVVGSEDIDQRSDLYALAMLLYRLLTGWAPRRGARKADIALQHLTEPLPPLPGPLGEHVIDTVYRRAGERDRELRYQNAQEMTEALLDMNRKMLQKKSLIRQPAVTKMP
jgi:serine/threonine-protein kinase